MKPAKNSPVVTKQSSLQLVPLTALMESNKNAGLSSELTDELGHVYEMLDDITITKHDACVQNMHYYLAMKEWGTTQLDQGLLAAGLAPVSTWTPAVGSTVQSIMERIGLSTPGNALTDAPSRTSLHHHARERVAFFQGAGSSPSIMLTMPSTATTDTDFIRQAVAHGVRFFRINSAHDSLDEWKQMATLIKKEAKAQKKEVLVAVDLASWKMRTGHAKRIIQPVELAQKKQTVSLVLTSKKGAYTCIASSSQAINHMATVALSKAFLQQCCAGATIKLTDVRGKKRVLHITHIQDDAVICTLTGKTIIDQDTLFVVTNHIQAFQECPRNIRPQPVEIIVQEGDMVYIGTDVPCSTVAEGDKPIALAFTDPVVLEGVSVGDHIYIDDGKLGLQVTNKVDTGIYAKVMYGKNPQTKILEEKGINFPDTVVPLPALSPTDKELLPQIAKFADVINISFVQSAKDIHEVQAILKKAGKSSLPLVAKIETKEGVKNLPSIIEALIAHGVGGVMIARGDLAVEAGFATLPAVQQEILTLCASAHFPVIYATGVMEGSMKSRLPARAEMIDLAQSVQANCLMLNKGPYVFDTIKLIGEVYEGLKK